MAFLIFGLPVVLFTAIGRAAAPARPASGVLGRLGQDLARGLRVCAMTAPQHLTAGSAAPRAGR
ncbi:hypothetical protein ACH9EU_17900 [Kocuria sp. M1R5S2]|uniref:hypothetical protein n=1 Tax=Kocuria rhizosphaerae TaxID=3376285 RepID=UPI0037B87D9B